MKFSKLTLAIAASAAVFTVGCATATKTVSEESLGLRNVDLYSETTAVGDKTQYSSKPAGTSTKIDRAFENAPPMIPHSVDGMLPITINNNQCTSCHDPMVASSMGATPLPKSHFTDFRPGTSLAKDGRISKEGKAVTNTSDFKTVGKPLPTLAGARFNCSQCHAPQSEATEAPKNVFKADFRYEGANQQSNLIDNINEGVK